MICDNAQIMDKDFDSNDGFYIKTKWWRCQELTKLATKKATVQDNFTSFRLKQKIFY